MPVYGPYREIEYKIMWRHFLPLGIFLILLVFLFVGLFLNPRELDSTLIDKPAPAFNLPKVTQPTEQVSEKDFQGEVALLNVWASWCVTCRQEHPLLMELARQNAVPLYGLNWKDERSKALAWLKRHGNPYRFSIFDRDGRAGIDYGVTGTPETFVLDKRGVIRHKHVGAITVQVFEETLWPMLEKLRAEPDPASTGQQAQAAAESIAAKLASRSSGE